MHGFGILDFGRTSSIATNALTCLHYQLTGLWPWEVAGKVVGGFPAASCVLINSKMNKTCKVSVLANGSWIVWLPSAALPAEEETWNWGSFLCEEVRFKSLLRLLQSAVSWLAFKVFFNLYLLWFSPQICCFVCWISHPWPNMQSKKVEDRDQNLTLRQSSRRFAVCPMCTHRVVDSFETSGMKLCYAFVFTFAFFVVGCVGSIKSMGRGFQTPLVVYPKSSHQSSHQSHHIQNPPRFLKQNCHFKDSLHPLMPVVGSQARQRCYDGRLCCPPRQEEIQSPPGLAGEVVLIISMEKIQIDTDIQGYTDTSYHQKEHGVLVCFLSLQKALLLFFPLFFLVL